MNRKWHHMERYSKYSIEGYQFIQVSFNCRDEREKVQAEIRSRIQEQNKFTTFMLRRRTILNCSKERAILVCKVVFQFVSY